jgi:L-alanine-DL-glutamate epimerase-like enolase superfamily enzyme
MIGHDGGGVIMDPFVIDHIESFTDSKIGIVRVRLGTCGSVGVGQVGGKDVGITLELLHQRCFPAVYGQQFASPEEIFQRVVSFELNYKQMGSQLCKAVSGIDSAVWDALGKREGKFVCELWGGIPRSISVYASSISRDISPEKLGKALLDLKQKHAIHSFKIKIGERMAGAMTRNQENKRVVVVEQAQHIMKTISSALSNCKIAVDCNGAYTAAEAVDVGHMLKAEHVWFYEEPIPWYEYKSFESICVPSLRGCVVLSGGEQEFRFDVFEDKVMRLFDLIQPDVGYCGGPSIAFQIGTMAISKGKQFIPHSPQPDLHLIMSAHLQCAFYTGKETMLELACVNDGLQQIKLHDVTGEFQSNPKVFGTIFRVSNGSLEFPKSITNTKGWGVELDDMWLSKAQHFVYNPASSSTLSSRSKL